MDLLTQSNWLVSLKEMNTTEEILQEYKNSFKNNENEYSYSLKMLLDFVSLNVFENKIKPEDAIAFIENQYENLDLRQYYGEFNNVKNYLTFVYNEYSNFTSKENFILNLYNEFKKYEPSIFKEGAYYAILKNALDSNFVVSHLEIIKDINNYLNNNKSGYTLKENPFNKIIFDFIDYKENR